MLLRFQRYPVAIAGNISEMYRQVKVKEEDRSMFRFFWCYLNNKKSPVIHEFTRTHVCNECGSISQVVCDEICWETSSTLSIGSRNIVRINLNGWYNEFRRNWTQCTVFVWAIEKKYGGYVVWNLISGCQTNEKCCIKYSLTKELKLISKIPSYHQQRHLV